MAHEIRQGSWHFLSGIRLPAVNMAMVHTDDRAILAATLKDIADMNVSAVLFLAGAAKKNLILEWCEIESSRCLGGR